MSGMTLVEMPRHKVASMITALGFYAQLARDLRRVMPERLPLDVPLPLTALAIIEAIRRDGGRAGEESE